MQGEIREMIKRILAGTLSAVLCSSAASAGLPAGALYVQSGKTIADIAAVVKAADDAVEEASEAENDAAEEVTSTEEATEAATSAEPTTTVELGENISADVFPDGLVVIRGYGEMNDYRSSPFENLKIKSVIFENEEGLEITSIGNNLFRGCDMLSSVSGDGKLTEGLVALPDSVKKVGEGAFSGCIAVKDISFGGAETLGSYAFADCKGLTGLTVPETVISMGRMAFSGCTELTELTLPYAADIASSAVAGGDVNPDCSVADLFYDQHWSWNNDAADFSEYKLTKITVTGGDRVPKYAFANMKSLTEIDLSASGLTDIDEYALYGCSSLKTIKFPSALKKIGESAFRDCTAMEEFDLADGIESIGLYAFANCTGVTSLTVPASVSSMGRMAFNGCTELAELTLPYSATAAGCANADGDTNPDCSVADLFIDQHWSWENEAMDFSPYKLTKITVTGGEKVPRYAFSNMSCLKEVDLSGTNIAAVDDHAFFKCSSLTDIKLPDTVTDIGAYAYSATPITELPDNGRITTLGNGVFADCRNLEITTLPESYQSIGEYGFANCTGITTFTVPANVTSMGRMLFNGCTELTELTLPYSATKASCAEEGGDINPDCGVADLFIDQHWSWTNEAMDFSPYKLSKITITGGYKVPRYVFAGMDGLTEIDLSGSGIVAVDDHAFLNCSSLTDIKLPETLKSLGDSAFGSCSAIKELRLVNGLNSIGEYAFANCTGISSLTIPDTVTSMGRMMVNGCYCLETLQLPYAARTAVSANADGDVNPDSGVADLFIDQHWSWANEAMDFSPYGISRIIITGGERIPRYAFSNMTTLREVDICGEKTALIDEYAFNNCSAMVSAEIPESVAAVKPNAFAGTNPDLYVYGKECELAEKALGEDYSSTVYGYRDSTSETYADENGFSFAALDGEIVISPKTLSLAIGDTYTVKTGVDGVTFSSDNESAATVDEKGVITAAAEGEAVIKAETADGSADISVTVRPRVSLYTLGDVNDDGKIDAKDASFILAEYAKLSTGSESAFTASQKKAADVNGDGNTDAKDASSILAYYAYISTNDVVVSIEDFLSKGE